MIHLDDWQQKVVDEGLAGKNIVLRSGRQVGKSYCISVLAGEFALKNNGSTVLILAATERQAYLLFEKVIAYLSDTARFKIKAGTDRPTKHICKLTNDSIIRCEPTGLTGYGIRGITANMIIVDECAFVPAEVFPAITPMLATTKGSLVLLSTPFGRDGFFYDCFNDPSFTSFHVSSIDCPRIDKGFLEREKARMTRCQWEQEYLGNFVNESRQFFSSELIQKCMVIGRGSTSFSPAYDSFCGVDVARMGEDETVILSVQRKDRQRIKMLDMEITEKTLLTETVMRIKNADKKYRFRKIYIDEAGMGYGVFDPLLNDEQTKRKVVGINNASKALDKDGKQKKKLIKEDLYNNLLWLMENNLIELFDEPELMLSLKSIQYEYTDAGELRIWGSYSHICEALIRACWCMKDKTLNIWAA